MAKRGLILGRNISINFVSQIIVFLTAFFTTPVILRGLGETDYSLLVFLTTVVGFFLALDFGITPAFVQAFSQFSPEKNKQSRVFFTSFILYVGLMLFWSGLIYLLSGWLLGKFFPLTQQVGDIAVAGLRAFCLVLFINAIGSFLALTFQALQKFHLFNIRPVLVGLLVPLGTIVLLKLETGLLAIIYWHLVVQSAVALILLILLIPYLNWQKVGFYPRQLRKMFGFAKWKFIGLFAGQIRQKTGRFFLTAFASLNSLAFYTIPQNMADRYLSLLPNITSPVFTMTAKLKGENKPEALSRLYQTTIKVINLFLLPLGIFLFYFSHTFLTLWIGADFAQTAAIIMQLLMLGYLLSMLNGLPTVYLEGMAKPNIPALFSILVVILYLSLSALLIPIYGLVGAAGAVFITYLVQTPIYILYTTKYIFNVLRYQFFLKAYFLPLTFSFFIGWLISQFSSLATNWLRLALLGVVFYGLNFGLSLCFGLIGKEEKVLIKQYLKTFSKK